MDRSDLARFALLAWSAVVLGCSAPSPVLSSPDGRGSPPRSLAPAAPPLGRLASLGPELALGLGDHVAEAAERLPQSPVPAADQVPIPFVGESTVTYARFLDELRRVADGLTASPEVQKGHASLLDQYELTPEEMSLESYSRVRLVFEATRDGGLWGVRWDITNRMPWSDAIWQQWEQIDFEGDVPEITAIAECDELSALFSFLVRDVGVQGFVGLFWPTWNHTVAVWELSRQSERPGKTKAVRILVPTSQVWLSREASLGTREFRTNRVVFPYKRQDLKPTSELLAPLARYLIQQLERYGGLSNERLLERRNRLGGS